MFKLIDISKHYGAAAAVHSISLNIIPNRCTVLIGPSGCGKSTLLRLMTGLAWPDRGTVMFDDQPIEPTRLAAIRLRIGYVIQEGGLFPHLTGLGNVTLMARHLRRPVDQIHARVEEFCTLTRFPRELLGRFPAELSGGQRQRIALMRALMLDPEVLLLDEPLAALDPMVRFDLQNDLAQIFRSLNKTVVLVTHDMNEAGFLADVIVLMRDGRIVQQGTVADLLERPAEPFVQQFVRAQRGSAMVTSA